MTENELVVYYRYRRFEIMAVSGPDGLYRAIVTETTTGEMGHWDLQKTGFSTAHELFKSNVGSIMEYVDTEKETA